MSGFKALKDKEALIEQPPQRPPEHPGKEQYPSLVHAHKQDWFAEEVEPITGEFTGIIGDDGTCKTAIALNGIPEGQCCLIVDFDGGGQRLRDSFYEHRRSEFKCQNPWVMQAGESRTAYDYPSTHNKVMKIVTEALAWAKVQLDPGYQGPRLHTVLVTAVDLWDSVAKSCMFIEDLGTAPDGIGASISPQEKVGMRFNWQIRTTRFHQLTSMCRELTRLGVNVVYETHWNYEQKADGSMTGKKYPKWEKQTSNYLHTIIEMSRNKIRDDEGRLTGETRYEASFTKSRSKPQLLDQTRLVMATYKDQPLKWHGLPELLGEGQ